MSSEVSQIWTIGHSTRMIEEFLSLLQGQRIELVADVRLFPGSRRYPHFGKDQLAASLASVGIGYAHFPDLGGRRQARPDSPNTAWRNRAFRGYADYMSTAEFQGGMERLRNLAKEKRVAVMCAEAVWWSCHRSLISDLLKVEGWRVWHILGAEKVQEHPYTGAATVTDGRLSYAA